MIALPKIIFVDNPVIAGRENRYATVEIDSGKVLESWKLSLFSYEWILPDGQIRSPQELSAPERAKRENVEQSIRQGTPLERPVLGIGLLETVEIGSGRAIFLTLAARDYKAISVHIPTSSRSEFDAFLL